MSTMYVIVGLVYHAESPRMAFAIDHEALAFTEHASVVPFEQFAERRFVRGLQVAIALAADDSLEQAMFPSRIH